MSDNPDPLSNFLFVALIVPDDKRRRALAKTIAGVPRAVAREFGDHPMREDAAQFAHLGCDIAIVDLDDDIEQSVRVIEGICSHNPSITVMGCSRGVDLNLVRRAMQAGARDFLAEPLLPETMRDAFARISSHHSCQEQTAGKLLVFAPSKAGVGVTSLATNFAIALTKASSARVVLVDMDLQRGDVALGLGLTASCSVADALRNPARLDHDFLTTILMRHRSGLAVLGSPEDLAFETAGNDDGAARLFRLLRGDFDYVVVDNGTAAGRIQETLFDAADRLYLVTELSFPSLRNAHRIIARLSAEQGGRNVEVVLNRCDLPHSDIGEEQARKALGRPVRWKVPNASEVVQKAWDRGVPLAIGKSPITNALMEMAKDVCGKTLETPKPSGLLSYFDFRTASPSAGA